MSAPVDLDALADERLDGTLDDDAWQALEAAQGAALAIALHQAQERRAAVAALARPPLPADLRARLLPAAPPPLRFPWRAIAVTAIAACLVVLVLPIVMPAPSADPAPALAIRQEAPIEADARKAAGADRDDAAFTELEREARSALADGITAPAPAAAPSAPPAVAPIGPHGIALAWVPAAGTERPQGGAEFARRERAASAALPSAAEATVSEPAEAPALAAGEGLGQASATRSANRQPGAEEAVGAASAASAASTTTTATSAADAAPSSAASLVVVLHNRTVTPWTIAADALRIEARASDGSVVWQGRIDAIGTLAVEPGGFLSVQVASADWPENAHVLRATLGSLTSIDLPLPTPP